MLRTRPVAAIVLTACALAIMASRPGAQSNTTPPLLADRIDVSGDFRDFANSYDVADKVVSFDPATASGTLK